jgi:hypothetical protein
MFLFLKKFISKMKTIFIIILIFSINWIKCTLKVTDFCEKLEINDREQKCKGNYSLTCAGILCAKDRYSCQSIRVLHGIKNIQKTEKDYVFLQNNFKAFMKLIQKCPKPKWNPNDVCLNTKNCFQTSLWRIWSTLLKPGECKCRGKYNYKCKSDYCALDKQACDLLKKIKIIKKCI